MPWRVLVLALMRPKPVEMPCVLARLHGALWLIRFPGMAASMMHMRHPFAA
jgi:hypothetical protein